MNFGHQNKFRMIGLTVKMIREKVKKRELFYNHFKDTTSSSKWESNHKLKQADLDLLPDFLIKNQSKFKDWFDL